MNNTVKSREEDADVISSISCLPDEIILQILKKIFDLKSLCCFYLVSKRFSSIVLQLEAISYTAPLLNPNAVGDVAASTPIPPKVYVSFLFATNFISKFGGMKSVSIQFPSSSHQRAIDNRFLFKWKVNIGSSSVESFIFLSPNSICDKDSENGDGEEMGLTNDLLSQKVSISMKCLKEVVSWHVLFMSSVRDLPPLEEVSITDDSGRRGRLSLSGEKLRQVKEWAHSAPNFNRLAFPNIVSKCYIPVLKLPVSGYVMKGVFCALVEKHDLQGGNEGLMNSDSGFEDKEGVAYAEAVKEILEKDMMHTYHVA